MSDKKLNASERITRLELALADSLMKIDLLVRDFTIMSSAMRLLDNKLSSVVALLNVGQALTDENIAAAMTKNNADELAAKTKAMVDRGSLESIEAIPAEDNAFVVIREVAPDGKVLNPRLQFLLSTAAADVQEKLRNRRVGDCLALTEDETKAKVELLEIYSLTGTDEQSADQAEA